MTEAEFRTLALAFPEVVEGANMGSTYFKANGKDLARLLGEGRAMLTGIGPDEADLLIEMQPEVFSASRHFRDAGCIAVELAAADPVEIRGLLDRRFRHLAKKSVLKGWGP